MRWELRKKPKRLLKSLCFIEGTKAPRAYKWREIMEGRLEGWWRLVERRSLWAVLQIMLRDKAKIGICKHIKAKSKSQQQKMFETLTSSNRLKTTSTNLWKSLRPFWMLIGQISKNRIFKRGLLVSHLVFRTLFTTVERAKEEMNSILRDKKGEETMAGSSNLSWEWIQIKEAHRKIQESQKFITKYTQSQRFNQEITMAKSLNIWEDSILKEKNTRGKESSTKKTPKPLQGPEECRKKNA